MTGKRIAILLGISALVFGFLIVFLFSQNDNQAPNTIGTVPNSEQEDGQFRLPRPIDFPATRTLAGGDDQAVAVDFETDPRAREYESAISEDFVGGPNFAGVYTVVTWGCGTACQLSAIIDARTGEIAEYGILSSYGVSYSTTTKLFAVNPRDRLDASGPNAPSVASDYYIFEDGSLQHILKIDEEGIFQRTCPELMVTAEHPVTGEVKTFPTPCAVPAGWLAQ